MKFSDTVEVNHTHTIAVKNEKEITTVGPILATVAAKNSIAKIMLFFIFVYKRMYYNALHSIKLSR